MLALSVLLAKYAEGHNNLEHNINLTFILAELIKTDNEFNDAISRSTTNKKSIQYVFATLKQKLIDKFL